MPGYKKSTDDEVTFFLTAQYFDDIELSQTSPGFYVSAVYVF